MAPRGPKPLPLEVKRKRGTLRPSRIPNGAPMGTVDPVETVDASPLSSFSVVVASAAGWLAESDALALALLRETLEEREEVRALVLERGTPELRRGLRDLDKQIVTLLAVCGFDPSSRARFGLAEVRAASTLERMRAQRER